MKLTQVLVMASGLSLSVAGFAGNPPAQKISLIRLISRRIKSPLGLILRVRKKH